MKNLELDLEESLDVIKFSMEILDLIEKKFSNQQKYSTFNMTMNVLAACQVGMIAALPAVLRDKFIEMVAHNLLANKENLKERGI